MPQLAAAALLAWLWNPLLLVASAVGAHNDMLMLALLLASFLALQRHGWLAALLLLVLAGHVKLTALTLAPVYGFWLVRQLGWRRALAYAAVTVGVGLAISWLLYAPLGGWATLPRMLEERQRYVALSFHHLLYRFLLARGVERELIWHLTIQWPTLLYVACSVALAWLLVGWRQAGRERGAPNIARLLAGGGGSQSFLSAGGQLLVSGVVRVLGADAGVAATRQPFHALCAAVAVLGRVVQQCRG